MTVGTSTKKEFYEVVHEHVAQTKTKAHPTTWEQFPHTWLSDCPPPGRLSRVVSSRWQLLAARGANVFEK